MHSKIRFDIRTPKQIECLARAGNVLFEQLCLSEAKTSMTNSQAQAGRLGANVFPPRRILFLNQLEDASKWWAPGEIRHERQGLFKLGTNLPRRLALDGLVVIRDAGNEGELTAPHTYNEQENLRGRAAKPGLENERPPQIARALPPAIRVLPEERTARAELFGPAKPGLSGFGTVNTQQRVSQAKTNFDCSQGPRG